MITLRIEDYDARWPGHFAEICGPIASTLDGMTLAIEHVGSSAVPGLAAKPIIDIDIVLRDWNDFPDVVNRLRPLGYTHQGDLGIAGREAFAGPEGMIAHHLYVCPPDSAEFRAHLVFRDYLRAHPETAAAYAALKRDLAARLGDDRNGYTLAKGHFVLEVLARANFRP
jgi:GrpB-like predicted nucleotidyltransferase (UPF0157 family)